MEHSLGDAWRAWWLGSPVELHLFGLELRWWGRIGKVLQFLAALSIIAEIIGPARLRVAGNSLHRVLSAGGAVALIRDTFAWTLHAYAFALRSGLRDVKGADRSLASMDRHPVHMGVNTIIGCLFGLTAFWSLAAEGRWLAAIFRGILALGFGMAFIAPVLTFVILFAAGAIGLLIDVVLVEPFAWLLEREYLGWWVKVVSAGLLLVGFHFDLLAS